MKAPHALFAFLEISILNHLPASQKFHKINKNTTPYLITKTEYVFTLFYCKIYTKVPP